MRWPQAVVSLAWVLGVEPIPACLPVGSVHEYSRRVQLEASMELGAQHHARDPFSVWECMVQPKGLMI